MPPLAGSIAYYLGKAFAQYCVWAVGSSRVHIEGKSYLPTGPAVLAGWHSQNLLSLGLHHYYLNNLPAICFTPPGIIGVAARGKLEGFGLQAVELPPDSAGNPVGALRVMLRALSKGKLAVFAVDGPYGPIYSVRPGALWLARGSNLPLIPMGFAAQPALPWLRWDRQLTPLPGSKIAVAIGPPIRIDRSREIDDELRTKLGAIVDSLTRRAVEALRSSALRHAFSSPPPYPQTNR